MDEEYHSKEQRETPNVQKKSLRALPEELKRIPIWMGTRFAPRPGKPGQFDKPPYRVRTGEPMVKADKTDPANWAAFAEALAAYESGAVDAIGIVLTEDDALFGFDCDGVLDSETGEINQTAHQIIHALGTYAEVSCSGRGLRAIGIGTKPEYAGCRSRALGFEVEVYDKARFMVMTGNHLPGTPEGIEERQGELEALCRQLWPKQKKRHRKPGESAVAHTIDDAELLERARRSRTGAKFRALYDRGDITAHNGGDKTPSGADMALMNMLIFWTAGNVEQMVRLFEDSALYRADEKHRDYVERTARQALASYRGKFYKPRRVNSLNRGAKEAALSPYLRLLLDPTVWRGKRGASAYKVYAAAVSLAAERGIDADSKELRIGCDVRTLAERSGTNKGTVCDSALPYLIQEMNLVRWRKGGAPGKAGSLVLPSPVVPTPYTEVSTHCSVRSWHDPDATLETLRHLIRMRGGRSKRAAMPRLGMVAMFVVVAFCAGLPCGYSLEELAEATGRRKPDLRRVLRRLKSAGIVREPSADFYRLTDGFRVEYENALIDSGVTRSERIQRMRHQEERELRDDKLRERKEKVKRLVHEGMREDFARREVFGREDDVFRNEQEVVIYFRYMRDRQSAA